MLVKVSNINIDSRMAAKVDIRSLAAERLRIPVKDVLGCRIVNQSVDCRKQVPMVVYTLQAEVAKAPPPGRWEECEALESNLTIPELPAGMKNPVVVGTGPAGIFGALVLAMAGARVRVIDRGFDVRKRFVDRQEFLQSRKLSEESNLLIGEGGAGTFSDGKLYTGTKDANRSFILKTLSEAAELPELEYLQRPHIGSDKLIKVAEFLRRKIESLGGEFIFGTEIADVAVENGVCRGVRTASGELIEADAVLLAPGLGGRKLAKQLAAGNIRHVVKGFQIGCRVEHPQRLIDVNLYHLPARPEVLGAAEYHWVSKPSGAPSAATFCMCPGGEVVMASAWEGHATTNGMSYFARGGEFANSALVMSLAPELFANPLEAWDFLEKLETRAFALGGGDYTLPAQDIAGFLRQEKRLKNVETSVRSGLAAARIDELLHGDHVQAVKAAVKHFEKFCPGFIERGKLIGQESCISSPVRFLRDEQNLNAQGINRLYIGGEFAGYAGGIVSSEMTTSEGVPARAEAVKSGCSSLLSPTSVIASSAAASSRRLAGGGRHRAPRPLAPSG